MYSWVLVTGCAGAVGPRQRPNDSAHQDPGAGGRALLAEQGVRLPGQDGRRGRQAAQVRLRSRLTYRRDLTSHSSELFPRACAAVQ